MKEACEADCVIVYREEGETLKGAFVEVGAALGVGTPVYAVGCDEFSFVHHERVFPCRDLNDAITQAMEFSVGAPPPAATAEQAEGA